MEKDSVQKEELQKEAELKKLAEITKAMESGKLVDVSGLDVDKLVSIFNDIKKQNAFLFDAIRSLNPHDKHFELKKNTLFGIANQIKSTTENRLRPLSVFLASIKDNIVDAKYMERIAIINKPNRESVKYGQAMVSFRKSFLNMAVKRASDKTQENASGTKQP